MVECNYGAERFDLRLTVLRLIRNLGKILLLTAAGTMVFGGGYYLKHVVFGAKTEYQTTITCKLEYEYLPVHAGDYYINEMTWNTYIDSEDFQKRIGVQWPFFAMDVTLVQWCGKQSLAECIEARVASDVTVPSFLIRTEDAEKTSVLSDAVQLVLTEEFAQELPEVKAIRVMDVSDIEAVRPDVRPVRAFVLSAVLSGFFAVLFFLIREIGADSIWLPKTVRERYGLKCAGTPESPQLYENLKYLLFGEGEPDGREIALCGAEASMDMQKVKETLCGKLPGCAAWNFRPVANAVENPECAPTLRQAGGVVLAVSASLHAGSALEYIREFLDTQDVRISAVLLWNADETLLRAYYFPRKKRGDA